jgi:hypothetical protein
MVIGIRWETITSGMKVIGLDHRTRGLDGCHLITMESGTMQVTGTAIRVGLNMTTTGIGTMTGTTTGTMTRATTTSRPRQAVRLRHSGMIKKLEAAEATSLATLIFLAQSSFSGLESVNCVKQIPHHRSPIFLQISHSNGLFDESLWSGLISVLG